MVTPRAFLAVLTGLAVTACAPDAPPPQAVATAKPVVKSLQRTAGPDWFAIANLPEITAYIDTSRLERVVDVGGRVWFRFEYAAPMQLGTDTVTRYRATEGRFDVNCRDQMARALELHVETTAGVRTGAPTPEQRWQPLSEQPLGSGVFYPACRALAMPLPLPAR